MQPRPVKPPKYDKVPGDGIVGQNVQLGSASNVTPAHPEGVFATNENPEIIAWEQQMDRYTPRGPPNPAASGVQSRKPKTQTTQRQTVQRTEQQIQPPTPGPTVANIPQQYRRQSNQTTGGQTPQPPQGQTPHPTKEQTRTPQPTEEGTPHDKQRSADKQSKKARVPAVTANDQTTAGPKR